MFALSDYVNSKKSVVNEYLNRWIGQLTLSETIRKPVLYAVNAGGKRLRPILCMAACECIGENADRCLPVASALEMVHTYSLIHDDLPAIDNDQMRRGQPTCHTAFDEATAILAGDALLTMAFEVLSHPWPEGPQLDDKTRLHLVAILSQAAGCRGMLEGQVRDIAFEGIVLDQLQLAAMHRLKTGALIRASIQSGACVARASGTQTRQLDIYADSIGLAFQVTDDILNVKGDPEIMGKAVGTDDALGKNTYPALLGLAASEAMALSLVDQAIDALSEFGSSAEPLRAIARYIIERQR